ncbi:hypothetical protein CEY00_Acc25747 [Actinidia chinensis var. chinensis]|uniref:Uncharacterized protein n=1 Tax=Actinidia chinensis var. chinensis TaxID=1590841 RepID=A0A2R6PPN7_ACTCC|nr:hypothetical protein CEY00_Acc25747 [Actinidia chinensis var. chinensis]
MTENPNDSSSTANTTTVKRYAPPNQRNRPLSRRRSGGDRFERMNNRSANDGENNQVPASRNVPIADHGYALGSNIVNENPQAALIPLQGCCKSEACELLNDRWKAAITACYDPSIDFTEKPVMYSRTGASAWGQLGQFRLPHQLMSRIDNAGPPGSQMDFLSELQRAIRDANASSEP